MHARKPRAVAYLESAAPRIRLLDAIDIAVLHRQVYHARHYRLELGVIGHLSGGGGCNDSTSFVIAKNRGVSAHALDFSSRGQTEERGGGGDWLRRATRLV